MNEIIQKLNNNITYTPRRDTNSSTIYYNIHNVCCCMEKGWILVSKARRMTYTLFEYTPKGNTNINRINKYFTISAKAVQNALKQEVKGESDKRFVTELKVQTLKDGEVVKIVDLNTNKEIAA